MQEKQDLFVKVLCCQKPDTVMFLRSIQWSNCSKITGFSAIEPHQPFPITGFFERSLCTIMRWLFCLQRDWVFNQKGMGKSTFMTP